MEDKVLTKKELEERVEYFKDILPNGCCVCAKKDGGMLLLPGDAEEEKFNTFASFFQIIYGGKTNTKPVKDVCSGTYIKVGGDE